MNRKVFTIISLAVMMFLLGTWAATAQVFSVSADFLDGIGFSSFLPIIFSIEGGGPPSGVLYVFNSTATTDGNAGGRSSIMHVCSSADPGAHFCSLHEIESAWVTTGIYFSDPFNKSWVDFPTSLGTLRQSDVFPVASVWSMGSENCLAWTEGTIGEGKTIAESARYVGNTACNVPLPVACCKYIP